MSLRTPLMAVLSAATLLIGLTGCPDVATVGTDPTPSPTDAASAGVHEGTISSSETWTKAKSPHVVRGDVYVESASGATLTIEPGAEVRFEQGAGLYFGWSSNTSGSLKAIGTSTESITFTSATSTKAKGDWDQIYVGNGGAATELSYCRIAYGGGDGDLAHSVLRVSGSTNKPSIRHCTFEENAGTAIYVEDTASFTAFENNAIKTSAASPIRLDANAASSLGAGNTFVSNGLQAIEVVGSTLTRSARWRSFGLPYLILGDTYVQSDNATPVLTLDAGNTLRFTQGSGLYVSWNGIGTGALYAVGTSTSPITFTGVENNPNAGAWDQLYLGDGAIDGALGNANSTCLAYVTVQYGGGSGGTDKSAVKIDSSKPLLDHVTIKKSAGLGLIVTGETQNVPAPSLLAASITFEENFENAIGPLPD